MVHVPGLHVPAPQGLQQENGGGLHRLPAGGQQGQADADEPPGPCLAATAAHHGPVRGNSCPTSCDSTTGRGCLSTSARTARSSPRRPRSLHRSSSPSTTHPTPGAWGCLASCPATSAHSCDSFLIGWSHSSTWT